MAPRNRPSAESLARAKADAALLEERSQITETLRDLRGAFVAAGKPPASPQLLAARNLGIAHLGCWIEVPDRPDSNPRALEPSVLTVAGRLVGIREGKFGHGSAPATRTLVVQQGPAAASLEFSVDRPILVAPRSWS